MTKFQHPRTGDPRESSMAQPRWGWGSLGAGLPRVVPRTGQPWAGGRNPVGSEGISGVQTVGYFNCSQRIALAPEKTPTPFIRLNDSPSPRPSPWGRGRIDVSLTIIPRWQGGRRRVRGGEMGVLPKAKIGKFFPDWLEKMPESKAFSTCCGSQTRAPGFGRDAQINVPAGRGCVRPLPQERGNIPPTHTKSMIPGAVWFKVHGQGGIAVSLTQYQGARGPTPGQGTRPTRRRPQVFWRKKSTF